MKKEERKEWERNIEKALELFCGAKVISIILYTEEELSQMTLRTKDGKKIEITAPLDLGIPFCVVGDE